MDFDGLVQSPQLDDDILRFEAGTKHGTKALMVMDDLRRREQLSDVTICVGKRRICAHKLVLASFSSYFLAMFTGGMIESSQDEVTLKDIDGKAVEVLIDFAYTGKLDITTDCVQPLLYTSSLFQLTAIQKACSDFLSRQLHPSNCLGIKSFADAHSCTELLHTSEKYINEHFTDVVKNEEFLLLPHEDLAAMLASEELNVDSEEDVYNSLITWARHDLEERQSFLAVLLEKIRLPLLSASFLIDQVEKEELIRQDIACRNLLDEAKNFHLLPERRLNASKSKCRQFCPRKSTLGILYSVGGMDSTGHSVRTVEKYDFHSGKVRLVCPTNIPRSGVGLAVVDKKLYAVGGHDGTTYLNSVECYDPKFKQWKFVASMASVRRYVAVGVINNLLYAVGGYDGTAVLDTVEVYDPRIDQWKTVASMRSRRRHAAIGMLTCRRPGTTTTLDYLYAVGGHDGVNYLKSVECYSPDTNQWTQVAAMSARRGGVAVGCLGGHLYATGGYNDTTNLSTSERYYPDEDRWSFVAPMNVGRSGHAVGVVGEYLYALGGHDGVSYRNTVEYFNPVAGEWKSIGPMGMCKAVAGVAVIKECKVHRDTVT